MSNSAFLRSAPQRQGQFEIWPANRRRKSERKSGGVMCANCGEAPDKPDAGPFWGCSQLKCGNMYCAQCIGPAAKFPFPQDDEEESSVKGSTSGSKDHKSLLNAAREYYHRNVPCLRCRKNMSPLRGPAVLECSTTFVGGVWVQCSGLQEWIFRIHPASMRESSRREFMPLLGSTRRAPDLSRPWR